MSAPELRQGWCPGALRPMPSGDGLIVRLRLTAGELPAAMAIAIAGLAETFGNGSLDLSRRANLQLRGVSEEHLPALTDALAALGLLDSSAEAEAVRNVVVSPLAGLDPACADGREIARQIERGLVSDARLQALAPKFGVVVDGGGVWPLGDIGADLALVSRGPGDAWRLRVGGTNLETGPLPAGAEAAAVLDVARCGLAAGIPRLHAVLSTDAARAIFEHGLAKSNLLAPLAAGSLQGSRQRPTKTLRPKAGAMALSPGVTVVAIGLPFGHLAAQDLRSLAEAAGEAAVLRLTPWRLLIVPAADGRHGQAILARAAEAELAVAPGDPRLDVEACTGSPGCANGTTRTREDAARLASLRLAPLDLGRAVHVSGCRKGCAYGGRARVTLIGRDGRYDIVLNGGVDDAPARRGVAADQVEDQIADLVAGADRVR